MYGSFQNYYLPSHTRKEPTNKTLTLSIHFHPFIVFLSIQATSIVDAGNIFFRGAVQLLVVRRFAMDRRDVIVF